MRTAHLKTYLLVIWGSIAILGAGLVLWIYINPEAGLMLAPGSDATSPLPIATFSASPPVDSATPDSTQVVIIATRHPGTALPLPPTTTPITAMPVGQLSGDVDPLTGLRVSDPALLERRPVAVKISSFPREAVRPVQSGLSLADVVYEYYIEDDLTRFIAVFYGQDASRAGPVRSARYFDENVMRMYHSSLVFASADERVRDSLIASDLKPLLFLPRDDNCPPLCRDNSIQGYNNVFVNTAGVGAFLTDNSRQALRPMFFYGILAAFSMQKMNRIYTHYSPYSYNYWDYDATQQKYLRYADNQDAVGGNGEAYVAQIDHLTNQQLTADNVVELLVPHNFNNDFDRADQVFNIQMIGSGTAYVFTSGIMYTGTWVRDQIDQSIELFDQTNHAIRLKPGETFFQVIDPESTISQDQNSIDFTFFIPPRVFTPTVTPTRDRSTPTPTRKHK